jgi:hypothetical protein
MNKTLKQIFRAFEMMNRCWDDPEGATGNADDDKNVDDNKDKDDDVVDKDNMIDDDNKDDDTGKEKIPDDVFDKYGIPEGVRDDESVIETVKERMKEDAEADKDTDDDKDKDKDKDDDTKDKDTDDVKDKDVDKDVKDKDKDEEFDLKFEKDITIGDREFKKEDLASTPQNILENIASIHAQLEAANEELESAKTANESVMDDPVVKERIARINEGKGDEPYDFYPMSKDTKEFIIKTFDLDPEDDDDKEKIMGLAKEINTDFTDNAEKAINNRLLKNDEDEKEEKLVRKGMDNVLGMQNYIDKKLHIKEKNIDNLIEQKEKHPEWKKYIAKGGLYEAQKALIRTGFTHYDMVSGMEPETLWAIVATKTKQPFAINTKERDKKIIKDHEKKLIDLFEPKKVAKALGSSKDVSSKKKHSILGDSVIEEDKLMDHEYVQSLFDKCKTDEEMLELEEEITAKLAKIQK